MTQDKPISSSVESILSSRHREIIKVISQTTVLINLGHSMSTPHLAASQTKLKTRRLKLVCIIYLLIVDLINEQRFCWRHADCRWQTQFYASLICIALAS